MVMDQLTREIQEEQLWCILFGDDILLFDETRKRVNKKLERWRDIPKAKTFKLSGSKTE